MMQVCKTTHMTSFAGGWVVMPNTIDWSFVFANADFLSNPTLYVTQIVIGVIFLLTVVWARRMDKKDILKVSNPHSNHVTSSNLDLCH